MNLSLFIFLVFVGAVLGLSFWLGAKAKSASLASLKGVLPDDLRVERTSDEPHEVHRKIELFQDWPVEFDEAIAPGHFAPFRKNVVSFCAGGGKEIAESSQRLHFSEEKPRARRAQRYVRPGMNLRTSFAVE